MQIKMNSERRGSDDGFSVRRYLKDEVLVIGEDIGQSLASHFVRSDWAAYDIMGEEAGQRKPSDGNVENTALTSSPTKRHVGDFDAYVQDKQEKKARAEYQEYCNENDPADILSFEDWCDWKNEPTGLDLTPFWEALKPKELRSVPTNPETRDMVDAIGAQLGSVA